MGRVSKQADSRVAGVREMNLHRSAGKAVVSRAAKHFYIKCEAIDSEHRQHRIGNSTAQAFDSALRIGLA